MFGKWGRITALLTLIGLVGWQLTGCGGAERQGSESAVSAKEEIQNKNQAQEPKQNQKQDPVIVQIGIYAPHIIDEVAKTMFVDPVKKKYPYITVEVVPTGDKKAPNGIPSLLAAGQLPDLIDTNSNAIENTKQFGIQYDMTEVIKRNNFDLGRFIPEMLQTVKTNNFTDYLVGLPISSDSSVMYYNKDIFDKFGVAYPKDGMTWEETKELSKKLTRMADGIQYRGLEPGSLNLPGGQLSLPFVDPKTHKSVLGSDKWRSVLQFWKDIYDIPGNGTPMAGSKAASTFMKDRTIAMLPART